MKKIISILKNNRIMILGVMVGVLFGFSVLALINQKIIMSNELSMQNNGESRNVYAAGDYSGTQATCVEMNCGAGNCGIVCCAPNSNGNIECNSFNGSTWDNTLLFD